MTVMKSVRARDSGLYRSATRTGRFNAITDVRGVRVGHHTLSRAPHIRTGVTAIRFGQVGPHAPAPAGLTVANGFGKLLGATQVMELGELETPIVLTATLSAFRAADALVSWVFDQPGGEQVRTLNPVVGECNDAVLSDIRARPVRAEHVWAALDEADDGEVAEGSVGAGTGLVALGFKAGIGTASRVLELGDDEHTLGVLVQANFPGRLRIHGQLVLPPGPPRDDAEGSCIVIVATTAPLDSRQLGRLSARAVYALGRLGASYAHGSGDYAIAVSTGAGSTPPDRRLDPLFGAALDATEEAVLNALVAAEPVTTADGTVIPGLLATLAEGTSEHQRP